MKYPGKTTTPSKISSRPTPRSRCARAALARASCSLRSTGITACAAKSAWRSSCNTTRRAQVNRLLGVLSLWATNFALSRNDRSLDSPSFVTPVSDTEAHEALTGRDAQARRPAVRDLRLVGAERTEVDDRRANVR